ncbi:LpqC, poly [Sphingomonas sp. DBB INV C78]|uniref:extracellular catalytic domain type 1 short-chain-length polyhydroxyalkanoate depolymerase n=1 Tax=Sphingomonas sp. DBB INV C78 TaxID=3349434 RepID=UPI0036D2AD6D
MDRLGDTIAGLAKRRVLRATASGRNGGDRLMDLVGYGSNPGALRSKYYVPDTLDKGAPLVVILHGCTQSAAAYDHGSGWSQLADELGFALLFPEQQRSNNLNLCFNWFESADVRRGSGEALSIRQMIAEMSARHDVDPNRIFVTGLSAGGAMASGMLATYPEVFAGGAIIAGLPFGCASSVREAFVRMQGHGYPTDKHLGTLVRDASPHRAPWPRISIWQGDADTTVDPSNAKRLVGQWRAVHGLDGRPSELDKAKGYSRQIWRDDAGRPAIEFNTIMGMGHGTPVTTVGPDACGASGPFMLETGISSTRHIAGFWGLTAAAPMRAPPPSAVAFSPEPAHVPVPLAADMAPGTPTRTAKGVGAIIEDALRAAGLMR